jgi:hypothetical protein
MRGAIPPLPQYAFMAWCLVKHRDNFIFTLHKGISLSILLLISHDDYCICNCNGNSSVSTMTRLRAVRPGFGSWAGTGNFYLYHSIQTGSGAHTASYSVATEEYIPGVKRARLEADHSPSPSVEVNNAWSYTSTPPYRFHGVSLS